MTIDEFLARTAPDLNSGCWLWGMALQADGYGLCQHRKKTLLAHRVSWELHCGEYPAGKFVCHRCDTPACVNPAHLFLGTQTDNMSDMQRKGRADRAKKRGQLNGRARITDEQAWEIRVVLASGRFTQREIARSYGVPDNTVSRLRRGESFPHVHINWPYAAQPELAR